PSSAAKTGDPKGATKSIPVWKWGELPYGGSNQYVEGPNGCEICEFGSGQMNRYFVEWPALVGIWPTLLDWSHSCSCAHTDCMAAAMIASCCCCSMSATACASCVDCRLSRDSSLRVWSIL